MFIFLFVVKLKMDKITKLNYKEVWKHLIETEGYKDGKNIVLPSFEICTTYGCLLDDSTIDNIVLLPEGEIRFYYDNNSDDYESLDNFTYEEIEDFYDNFINAENRYYNIS